jgi:CheY-like chemotaxis protein
MSKQQMLIVDDNRALRVALKAVFEDDYELTFAADGQEALREYKQRAPQVVLMDYKMPGLDGLETLEQMRAQQADSRVVLMSAYDERETVTAARLSGATDFVGKPFDVEEIKRVIQKAAPVRSRTVRTQAAPKPVISQHEVDELIQSTLRLACA